MNAWWAAALAGAVCGLLSGLGIGGGTLLMVWMTGVAALPQQTAEAIAALVQESGAEQPSRSRPRRALICCIFCRRLPARCSFIFATG